VTSLTIALAAPRIAASLDEGLENVRRLQAEAAARGARVVCFPEAYLPGLRGQDFDVPAFDRGDQDRAVAAASEWARELDITTILGIEDVSDAGRRIAAFVIGADGRLQGVQTKVQLDPSEERCYVAGEGRRLFDADGVPFGIAICHEGFRYPETVRWAARRGAKIVFHPHMTGSDRSGVRLTSWGSPGAPYYEQAIRMRGLENTVWFASVNYATRFPESATTLIDPSGELAAFLPYGKEGVLVAEVDLERATGVLARRFAPERYGGDVQ
jgi:predicted amidohydrolase